MVADTIVTRHASFVIRQACTRAGQVSLVAGVWLYFGVLILLPTGWLLAEAFRPGLRSFLAQLGTPEALHAFWLSFQVTAVVLAVNTVFGLILALVLSRQQFRGRNLLNAVLDLPFAVPPVIAGYMLLLLLDPRQGWFGPFFDRMGIRMVYAVPGIVLATLFVTLPFVARELVPVLEELGEDQEHAAQTLGASGWDTFFRVTLPSVKWPLLYGITLTTARSLGEFGAVLVVSGNVLRATQTATLHIHQEYIDFHTESAFAASVALGLAAIALMLGSEFMRRRGSGCPRAGGSG